VRLRAILLAAAVAATACAGGAGGAGGELTQGSGATTSTTVAPSLAPAPAPALPPGKGVIVSRAGVVMPVLSGAGGAYTVTTPCSRTATVTEGTPLARVSVVLDPGHGGTDPGAVSPGGLREKVVNLAVAGHTMAALEAAGVAAIMTRSGDHDLNLQPRADIAKALDARAFVSIHHNAEPDGPWPRPGSETYYQTGSADSKRLSGLIYEEVVAALSRYGVAWVADTDAGAKYRQGNRGDYYAVLRLPAPVVSSLVELAFISNPPEAELLARPEFQRVEGEAVARGILRYLNTRDPGSGFTEPYPRPTPPPGPPGPPPACTDPPLQ